MRERVRVSGDAVEVGLDVVAEKRGERLVVIGFNAFGAEAFAVTQRGLDVEVDDHLGRALAVPPRNVLRDLHAARFADLDAPDRVEIERPACGYRATLVRVEHRGLSAAPSP